MKNLQILKLSELLETTLLVSLLVACALSGNGSMIPTGSIIPASEYPTLAAKYDAERDTRKDEIELQIQLPQTDHKSEEKLTFNVTINNRTDEALVLHRLDSTSNRVSTYLESSDEIVFVVTPNDPNVSLIFRLPAGPFPGAVGASREEFVLLPPGKDYRVMLSMPQLLEPMPPGQYSVFLVYRNYEFAADGPVGSDSFIDYHAWLGEITSNTLSFEIIP